MMIGTLEGTISHFDNRSILVELGGVGYKVLITQNFLAQIKEGEKTKIWTHLVARENAMELFGFENKETLDFFELLITVSGIGPKTALNILNIASAKTIKEAVSMGDINHMTKVSGIGKKIAEKIIVGLRDKIDKEQKTSESLQGDVDVLEALKSLGYSVNESREALKEIPPDIQETTEKIKEALKILSG